MSFSGVKFYVILVEPENPGNIGFTSRLLMNFDFENLILVNPKCNLNEAYIYAAHAEKILEKAIIVNSIKDVECIVDFLVGTTSKPGHDYNVFRMPITPKMLVKNLSNLKGKVGIIFGRESIGLKNEEVELCDFIVTIPTSEAYPALNLSHAVAIILYEIFTSIDEKSFKGFREASLLEKKKLLEYFEKTLEKLNYPHHRRKRALIVFRHIIGRTFISGREAFTIMGVFRRILIQLAKCNDI